ncbi:MAG: F0F1 ATP synthase subunit A [Alphaproteobacteria bacterium]
MADPVHQFVIKNIAEINIAGYDVSFTNSALWMVIAGVTSATLLTLGMRKKEMIPGRAQMAVELFYEFMSKTLNENTGKKGRHYFPFVFTIFTFVLFCNVLGLLPYSFTPTSQIIVTGALALMVFIAVIALGVYNHGLRFFSIFIPHGVPMWLMPFIIALELVSFFVRPITHSVRLFANMMAGHMMLKIIIGFSVTAASAGGLWAVFGLFPAAFDVLMLMFELFVAGLQAYVFAILTCIYLKDSIDIHH